MSSGVCATLDNSGTAEAHRPRILCVDDDRLVLEGLEVHLGWDYELSLATSGEKGLEFIRNNDPYAVIISDMRMPGMDGAEFLSRVHRESPDSTRMLLTGQADMEATIAAVNKGHIFRFLHKPCPPDVLLPSIRDALRQYELILSERELLAKTLNGTVKVLTEVMGLTTPIAFNRANALKAYVKHMCQRLGIEDTWQYELAASLSQLGCIALPPEVLDKLYTGLDLLAEEKVMLDDHPNTGKRLLEQIPRLELVAQMICRQKKPEAWKEADAAQTAPEQVALGSNMLAVALAVDDLVLGGAKCDEAARSLLKSRSKLNATLLEAMCEFSGYAAPEIVRSLMLKELTLIMIPDEDIVTKTGNTVVPKGQELTRAILERLHNFSKGVGIAEPIRVRFRK